MPEPIHFFTEEGLLKDEIVVQVEKIAQTLIGKMIDTISTNRLQPHQIAFAFFLAHCGLLKKEPTGFKLSVATLSWHRDAYWAGQQAAFDILEVLSAEFALRAEECCVVHMFVIEKVAQYSQIIRRSHEHAEAFDQSFREEHHFDPEAHY